MYTLYYPSGRLFLDDVLIDPQDESNQAYTDYVTWLMADNGPTYVPDPPVAAPAATAAQLGAAMSQLGFSAATLDQLTGAVFPLAVTL
jgi:hypothetical protein